MIAEGSETEIIMNEKKRKFLIRLMCLILAGLMVISAGIVIITTILS